ncbi:MAG: substrate-binding domain-containing protein [Oscillospiraceae bacterium]
MKVSNKRWFRVLSIVLVFSMVFALAACGAKAPPKASDPQTSEPVKVSENSKGYKIGWSNIYMTPSWMQQVGEYIDARIEHWKAEGVVSEYTLANANGDTATQIAQIENMISQGYDAIVLIAGSATALNAVVDKCKAEGVVVVNFDSLVTTDSVTCTINNDNKEYAEICAEWMGKTLGGTGKVVTFTGPAGIASAEERAQYAEDYLAKNYPDIKVVSRLNAEYNEAPSYDVISPVLDANPDLAGIVALGGSQASGALKACIEKKMIIPISSENYNAFLRKWDELKPQGFSSIALAHPCWLGALAVDQCVRILNGEPYDKEIIIPIPLITDDNLSDFVPNEYPDDYFPLAKFTDDMITEYLTPKSK